MFRWPRAGLSSSFRRRPSRLSVPREAPPRFRLRIGQAFLVAGASGAGLLGCSDFFWEPAPTGGDASARAPVVSQAGLSADVDSLPSWQTVIQGIGGPGCEFYFGTATGSYVSRKYVLEFSPEAKGDTDEVWGQQYKVLVTVSRPKSDGGKEVLPERVAVLAVCLLPGTERASQEATGSVKAILKDVGIPLPDKVWASARPSGGGPWAELWRLASGWAAPRSLLAAQREGCYDPEPETECEPAQMKEILVTTGRTCPVGLDYDVFEDDCVLNFVGEGTEWGTLIPPRNPGTGRIGLGGTNPKGGDDGDEGSRVAAFRLNCSSPSRGSTGGCRVTTTDTAVTLADLTYAWRTGAGVSRPIGGRTDYTRWEGRATSTLSMTVSISGPEVADTTMTGIVEVTARTSSVVSLSSSVSYTGTWTDGTFGMYEPPTHTSALTDDAVFDGSGPWAGQHGVGSLTIPATIVVHNDLDPQDRGYPGANLLPANQHCHATALPARANLVTVNTNCGSGPNLTAFERDLIGHENDHQDAIAACLSAQAARGDQADMETLVSGDRQTLKQDLERAWRTYYRDKVLGSTGGAVAGFTSQLVWDYWDYTPGVTPTQRGGRGTTWVYLTLPIQGHRAGPCR